ncbi:hypothetical protein BKA82DRAFT_996238 [Pisolithus tinctorius]|uniref:Transcriptional adapter 2 n=1 Tax=Pisolithus tinctorius Marx 270 TaxID=870435 RepID=A0A0C3PM66_PISTI|nr:hypothetical protein BKA82DRAFT_996238 [Pisolithus tinctorius]KIO09409.1 hypothetical protein M404DRAFT_996238 [Pisolithus tinctorius Marx 270]
MTVSNRKREHQPDEIQTVNEPGLQIQCDACLCDLTHSIRIKCADPVCEPGDGVDICPACFCAGKEFGKHKRGHAYRVIELHSYPIFSPDWGADEELLLIEGISKAGLGNWQMIAEHIGTRTSQEVEGHYNSVYIDSPDWPLPKVNVEFDVDPDEFHQRKRRRMAALNTIPPPPKVPPTSAPGVHEVATFLPGRLEFEHELDNEAEELVKDLEFGICLQYGGDQIIEDENDPDVKGRWQMLEERKSNPLLGLTCQPSMNGINGDLNGHYSINGDTSQTVLQPKTEESTTEPSGGDDDQNAEEPMQPPPYETDDSLAFKLTLIEMYNQRVAKRHEAKAIMYDRGLLDYKKMQAAEKKRPKEEKDIVNRLRPFARLQTAEDYEVFVTDILYEAVLRKRIQELHHYRRMGLTTAADIDKYEHDTIRRANMTRDYYPSERLNQLRAGGSGRESEGRKSHERESTPKLVTGTGPPRRAPAPLNLANSPSLHLLTPAEQTLCSQLRILPKPYLVIKETLVREYARRGGKLRRREARDLVKIDVNKTSRVWDFLVQAGYLKITPDPQPVASQEAGASGHSQQSHTTSPSKDQSRIPPSTAAFPSTSDNSSIAQPKSLFASPTISSSSWPQSDSTTRDR